MHFKFPRTPHLPWSPGTTSDDRLLKSTEHFAKLEIVVSQKLDGENTSIYQDRHHARSIDSLYHPSRAYVRELYERIKSEIPTGWRICGENVFAKHSIHYQNLNSYFYVFSIFNDKNECLSWDETLEWTNLLGLISVPEIYRGPWDENKVKACWTGKSDFGLQEGYVVRNVNSFNYCDYAQNVAKYVRKGHVQTSQHWLREPIIRNLLQPVPRN